MGILKKSTPRRTEMKVVPDEKDGTAPFVDKRMAYETSSSLLRAHSASAKQVSNLALPVANEAEPTNEGQLAVDVFQTPEEIVVVAPIAGVTADELQITITDDILTIQGARNYHFTAEESDYFTKECFWGSFSRSVILPEAVDTSKVTASFKNGILTLRIPKVEKIHTRMVKIEEA